MTRLINLQQPNCLEERGIQHQQLNDPDSFQGVLDKYWPWHYDPSQIPSIKRLLLADLKWKPVTPFTKTTSSVTSQQLISPLGLALSNCDTDLVRASLEILDSTVEIVAGDVLLGTTELDPILVDHFRIGRYPVTNAQYERFVEATGHPPPADWRNEDPELDGRFLPNFGDHPVSHVSCTDAEAYADWIGGRLPSFEEWERAARGDDARNFPWGNEIDKPRCNTAETGVGNTTPVGTFPDGISPFGCYDLLGNVWEWSSTWYDENQTFRLVRGGAWYYNHDHASCSSYDFFSHDYSEFVIGFRVAFD